MRAIVSQLIPPRAPKTKQIWKMGNQAGSLASSTNGAITVLNASWKTPPLLAKKTWSKITRIKNGNV